MPHALLATLSDAERFIAHGALLAQVDDNHVGGVAAWDLAEHETARAFFDRLDRPDHHSRTDIRALLLALLYPVHDLDHPLLSDAEADASEQMLSALATTYGR